VHGYVVVPERHRCHLMGISSNGDIFDPEYSIPDISAVLVGFAKCVHSTHSSFNAKTLHEQSTQEYGVHCTVRHIQHDRDGQLRSNKTSHLHL